MHDAIAERGLAPAAPPESLPRLMREWGIAPASPAPAAARLGAWLGWAEAIEIAQLLTTPPGAAAASDAARIAALKWARAELEQVRADVAGGFDAPAPASEDASFAELLAPCLQHFAQQQRLIASRITTFRVRLRMLLADACASLARLAQLDEHIERALAPAERHAAAGLKSLLEMRARKHHASDPRRWRPRLLLDLQRLLRAELDHRLQAVLGLIEALEAPNTNTPR